MALIGVARFHIADYVVFVIFIVASLSIGVYHALSGGRQRTTKEYLTADRQLKVLPTALSLLVSFQSAIMLLGLPAEMYMRGAQMYTGIIGLVIGCFLTTRLWVPLFYQLKITSTFEYLELRFQSVAVRKLGSFVGIIGIFVYMGTATFAPSTALEAVTGFPVWASILVTSVVGTIYTSIGGMKAVIWTDVFQTFIMFGGVIAVMIVGVVRIGGFTKVFTICADHGRLNFFDFNPDPSRINTFWGLIVYFTILWSKVYGTSQASVQRFSSLPTLKQGIWSVYIAIPLQFLLTTLVCFVGLVIFAYYAEVGCDPLAAGYIKTGNQVLPYFVMDTFRNLPGFPGLFLATLFSGALSSISSGLNALSALTWEDFLKDRLRNLKESNKAMVTKILVVVYGLGSIGIACVVMLAKGPVIQASGSLFGAINGPATSMFILAAFTKSANWKGVIVGPTVTFFIMIWIAIGGQLIKGHSQYLPPGPTDTCFNQGISNATSYNSTYMNSTSVYHNSVSLFEPTESSVYSGNTSSVHTDDQPLQGIEHLYSISYLWYTFIGILLSVSIAMVVSWLTGSEGNREIDSSLILDFGEGLCCCCPENIKHCECTKEKVEKDTLQMRQVYKDTKFHRVEHENGHQQSSQF